MFPIPFNFPFRKKDGSITTMDDAISSGGGGEPYVLPTASATTKGGVKVGAGLTMDGETLKNTNPTPFLLPIASAETLGGVKVGEGLSIENGVLSASGGGGTSTKIYFKEFSGAWGTNENLAAFESGAAKASIMNIAKWNVNAQGANINISGYTPIAALAWDKNSGYNFGVFLEYYKSGGSFIAQPTFGFSNRAIDNNSCGLRVFYIKNEDLEELT